MSQPPVQDPYPGGSPPNPQAYPGQPQPYPGQPQPPGGYQGGYPGGYPAPAAGAGAGAGAPPKKSKAGKIILIVVATLVVLCGGGGLAAYFAFADDVKDVVEASQTRLVAPDTLNGRPKITQAELQTVADTMIAEMRASLPDATSTVGAFYGNPAVQDMVMIAGASGRVVNPAKQLDDAATSMNTGGLTVTNMASVDPGPLGGVAKCGDATASEATMGVCIWADNGSVGVVVIYFKTAEQTKAEFVTIRGQVEQRS